MMLLDVFLEGLFEMDLRRVNSEEVREPLLMVELPIRPMQLMWDSSLQRVAHGNLHGASSLHSDMAVDAVSAIQSTGHRVFVAVLCCALQVGHAMNTVLHEANERIKFPLRKLFINMISPSVSHSVVDGLLQL
jgi:hypothetical protein